MISIFLLFLAIFSFQENCFAKKLITWERAPGRTGDQLITYCKAKWISEHLGIPLLMNDYPGFEEFVFWEKENKETDNLPSQQKRIISKNINDYCRDSDFDGGDTLFVTDMYFAHELWSHLDAIIKKNRIFPYTLPYNNEYVLKGHVLHRVRFEHMFHAYRQNKILLAHIKLLFQIKKPIKKITIPQNNISIAVHVRKGGGFDLPYKSDQEYPTVLNLQNYKDYFENKDNSASYDFVRVLRNKVCDRGSVDSDPQKEGFIDIVKPLKHPPDQYYIDQLKMLIDIFDSPLYVYIFTDDPAPEKIAARFKAVVESSNVIFDYRTNENNWYSNVLDDMLAMSEFDILIRPYSSFSQIAQLIGNHKLIISPAHGIWFKNRLIIDEIIIEKGEQFNLLRRKIKV